MCYLQPKTWMFTILTMVILTYFGLGHISTRVLKDILQPPQPAKMQKSISAGAQQENIDETEKATDTCSPKRKYVFVALHKVGSTTTINIFNRYALTHELSMLLPASGNLISWGASPTEEDYIHTPDEQYDVLTNHYHYNKTWIRSKFPANTAYISIIREPSKQLRSAMNYYNIETLLKMRSTNPMKTFLEDPWKFKNLSEAYFPHRNLIFDPTRNFMSFDLGYPAEAAEDMERARLYIKELEADFTLIMLLDYLDESLVLLKRVMCWDLQDVLVLTKNNRTYPFKIYDPTEEELANLRRWKAVDYLLYDTFNRSLWRQIAEQGPDFFEELSIFKDMSKHVHAYCSTGHKPAIIREPSKQLRSAMNYYNIETLLKMRSTNPMKTFLEDPWKFKNLSEAYFPHRNLIFDPTRNFMSFDLGYPAEAAEDMERARRYIKELEADFTLIMLLDYLDESLVLLKRLMCWDLQDILVLTKNNRTYPFKIYDPTEEELANLRRWKAVDYLLYDTFNRSLWRQIAEQGPDFFEELSIFKDMSKHVHAYCSTGHQPETYLTVEASKWNPQFQVDDKFCGLLRLTVMAFLQRQRPNAIGRALMSTKMNLMAIAKGHRTVKYLPDRKYHNITKA
ncbi:PREDICTED: uncharacterized protein LOC109462233 [Branchiostoma belcheri]|uniref:Uncharacterized protein LOC109462233 n=1 Tax=Branchiostoma belcheri TaxID=7741 RepID=A0A6P4XQE8_BRABE|nr:PREDICTED: uncharacterized protein LOC109462233 [Branchiostoma belcheri]